MFRRVALSRPCAVGAALVSAGCSSNVTAAATPAVTSMTVATPSTAVSAQVRFQQGTMRPGDWMCSSCNSHNYANRSECFRCHTPKGADQGGDARPRGDRPQRGGDRGGRGGGRGGGNGPRARPGDWACPNCSFNNYASRSQCMKCDTAKPANVGTAAASGDWTCPACNTSNFARRTTCFGCQAPKP